MLHLNTSMGLQLGINSFTYKITDSSGAYVLGSELEDRHMLKAAWHLKIIDTFSLRLFPFVWTAKNCIPQLEFHG